MNNKGQTLILFLFLLPVIFLLFFGIYQVGSIKLEKMKIEDSLETVIQYGLEHWSEETIEQEMMEMFQTNFPKIKQKNINIEIDAGQIRMTVMKEYNILFLKREKLNITYVGTNIDGKVQIVKE